MKNIIYILLIIIVLCGYSCSGLLNNSKSIAHIDDIEQFYAADMDWIKREHKQMELNGTPSYISMYGLIKIIITPTDTSYIIKRIRPEYKHCLSESSKDTIIFEDKIIVCEVPRNNAILDSLFCHVEDTVCFYDFALQNNDCQLLYARFALLDSNGNIKVIANEKTYTHTQAYYKRKFNKQLPITEDLLRFISQFILRE